MAEGRRSVLLRVALILVFVLPALPLRAGDRSTAAKPKGIATTPWQEVASKDGVTIFSRTRTGSPIKEFRGVGEIDSSSHAIFAALDDAEAYTSFMPYTAECRVLQRAHHSRVTYQRLDLPLVADRDYTVRSDYRVTPGAVGPRYFVEWQAANDQGPPPKAGVKRVRTCEGSWLLEPLSTGKTRATYSIYSGMGGSIPAFIANHGCQTAIYKVFDAIREQARKPKYAESKG